MLIALPGILGKGQMAGEQPRTVDDRKSVSDRPGRGEQNGASNVRKHADQERPSCLVQDQFKDAGQFGVWHAGAYAGLHQGELKEDTSLNKAQLSC